jgi:hypothetical protein
MAMTSASAKAVRSVAEVADLIRGLSDAETLIFKKGSVHLSFGGARGPKELRHEAVRRAISGSRKCPHDLPILPFLYGVMKSIASADRKAIARNPELSLVPKDNCPATGIFEGVDPRSSPEDQILMDEEMAEVKRRILALFEDDAVAQALAEGMMGELEGQELRELTGLGTKDFASKRRFVRRRIDKAFPQGWKP